jgi:hypothetical protein
MRRKEEVARYVMGSPVEAKAHARASTYDAAIQRKPSKPKDKKILESIARHESNERLDYVTVLFRCGGLCNVERNEKRIMNGK